MTCHSISDVRTNTADDHSILVEWDDGHIDRFHYIWLRDNDPALRANNCQISHDPFTLDIDVKPNAISHSPEEMVVEWSDGHGPSRFGASWLEQHTYRGGAVEARRPRRRSWTAEELNGRFQKHAFHSVSCGGDGLRDFLQDIWDHGFAVLENVPERDGMVVEVAKLFSFPRETNYGVMFELMGSPTAEDRGHDNAYLPSHVDNPYRNPIPTVQLLHFMRSSVSGGETTLVDGIRIAEEIQARDPEAFELLTTIPVIYRYRDDDVDLSSEGPIIRTNQRGEITGILVSPINVQPFDCSPDNMVAFYKAYQLIGSLISSAQFRFQTKLSNGDLIVMDNTRLLHGRTAFLSDGTRRLQGCYADSDGMWSKLAVLNRPQIQAMAS